MNSENYWDFFARTGNLEAYLNYIEFLRLTSSENADEITNEVDVYDIQNERCNLKRSEHQRLGQDVDSTEY